MNSLKSSWIFSRHPLLPLRLSLWQDLVRSRQARKGNQRAAANRGLESPLGPWAPLRRCPMLHTGERRSALTVLAVSCGPSAELHRSLLLHPASPWSTGLTSPGVAEGDQPHTPWLPPLCKLPVVATVSHSRLRPSVDLLPHCDRHHQ